MSSNEVTDYDKFASSSAANKRALRQEELILKATQVICEAMDSSGTSQAELARKLKKSEAFVSQTLSGERNMTLRTLADFATALSIELDFESRPDSAVKLKNAAVVKIESWASPHRKFELCTVPNTPADSEEAVA